MHLVIDHAAPSGPHCQTALATLQLPHLAALLRRLAPAQQLTGEPHQLTPLSEHLRAAALGIDAEDGLLPWAAADAQRLGLKEATPSGGWAWITPCHWQVNADHVEMLDQADLALSEEETATLMESMRGYFLEDGITVQPLTAGTWLAYGAAFKGLATASLERARGARIDRWMPRQAQARTLRRLQNEMQMLLYTHPINDARSAKRRTTVNSFWVSGTGDLPESHAGAAEMQTSPISVNTQLRAAALRDDAAAWLEAWHILDRTDLATADARTLTLTLCGEHQAVTFAQPAGSWLTRLRQRFTTPNLIQLLSAL